MEEEEWRNRDGVVRRYEGKWRRRNGGIGMEW